MNPGDEDDDDENDLSFSETEVNKEVEELEDARSEVRNFLDQFNIYYNRLLTM